MPQMNIIQTLVICAIPVLFAVTVHEVAHGWMASKLGDKTALMLGRLTLNPIKHIDLFGTIVVPLMLLYFSGGTLLFGWARPVPVNYGNLKKPRRDMALIALAGPLSNFFMAVIWAAIAKLGVIFVGHGMLAIRPVVYMGLIGIQLNIIFMVLNLIPIPPLDGSRIVSSLLPPRWAFRYNQITPFGFFILLALLVTNVLSIVIGPAFYVFYTIILKIFGL